MCVQQFTDTHKTKYRATRTPLKQNNSVASMKGIMIMTGYRSTHSSIYYAYYSSSQK